MRDGSEPFDYIKWLKFFIFILPHPKSWEMYIHLLKDEWKWRGVEWWHRYE